MPYLDAIIISGSLKRLTFTSSSSANPPVTQPSISMEVTKTELSGTYSVPDSSIKSVNASADLQAPLYAAACANLFIISTIIKEKIAKMIELCSSMRLFIDKF